MSKRVIIDELEFEVPYGKLAAKTWGEETDETKRVLLLHGWMDNAGSFDNLAPLLHHEDGLYIVAIDLPGHGKSSQLPPGCSYNDLTNVMEVRRCLTELGWIEPVKKSGDIVQEDPAKNSLYGVSNDAQNQKDPTEDDCRKFTIIGHSFGAGVSVLYSGLFPREVESVVLLDFIKSRTISPQQLFYETASSIDSFINTVPSQSPFSSPNLSKTRLAAQGKTADKGSRTVSYEAAIVATIDAHKQLGKIDREGALSLIKRSSVAVSTPPNSIIYNRDLRLNSMLNMREHWDVNKIMFLSVRGHVLSLLAKEGLYARNEQFADHLETAIEYLKTKARSLTVQWVEGDHYFHMTRPAETAQFINKYLKSPSDYVVESLEDKFTK